MAILGLVGYTIWVPAHAVFLARTRRVTCAKNGVSCTLVVKSSEPWGYSSDG